MVKLRGLGRHSLHLIRLARAEEALSHVLQYVCELTSWPCHIAPGCALGQVPTQCLRKRVRKSRATLCSIWEPSLRKSFRFPSFGSEFDGTSPQESLGLFNTTHSELTETSKRAWDVNG